MIQQLIVTIRTMIEEIVKAVSYDMRGSVDFIIFIFFVITGGFFFLVGTQRIKDLLFFFYVTIAHLVVMYVFLFIPFLIVLNSPDEIAGAYQKLTTVQTEKLEKDGYCETFIYNMADRADYYLRIGMSQEGIRLLQNDKNQIIITVLIEFSNGEVKKIDNFYISEVNQIEIALYKKRGFFKHQQVELTVNLPQITKELSQRAPVLTFEIYARKPEQKKITFFYMI